MENEKLILALEVLHYSFWLLFALRPLHFDSSIIVTLFSRPEYLFFRSVALRLRVVSLMDPVQPGIPIVDNEPMSVHMVPTEIVYSDPFIIAQAAGYNPAHFCRDILGEFDGKSIPTNHLKGIVRKTGYTRCSAPRSGNVPVITGKYRLLNDATDGKLYSITGGLKEPPTLTLDCMFAVSNPSNPQSHHPTIRLTRVAPFLERPLDALGYERSTVDFNVRMAKGIKSQKKECISMLDGFIRMQNEFYRRTDAPVTPDKFLRSLEESGASRGKNKDGSTMGVPSYSTVFFIILIIAAFIVGGFLLWRRYFQRPKVRRVRVSQSRNQRIADV